MRSILYFKSVSHFSKWRPMAIVRADLYLHSFYEISRSGCGCHPRVCCAPSSGRISSSTDRETSAWPGGCSILRGGSLTTAIPGCLAWFRVNAGQFGRPYATVGHQFLPTLQPLLFKFATIQRSRLAQVENQLAAVDHVNSVHLPPGVLLLLLVNLINHSLHLMRISSSEKSRRGYCFECSI